VKRVQRRRPGTVVFGPYPPIPGPAAAATRDEVRRWLAAGDEVRVVSPVPSAAHDHADLSRPAGALRFARRAVGAQRLVVHLDADLMASPRHRHELPARLALAAALRSARRSTVVLPAGHRPPGAGWTRLVLEAADEVTTEAGAEETVAGEPDGGQGQAPAWDLGPDPTREELEAEIRRRAALRRTAATGGTGPSDDAGSRPPVPPLSSLPLLGPVPPRSTRPVAALVKRVVRRLVAWQIDPVIEHVNLLHRAVVRTVESPPERPEDGR
jgi:hypothetical protein